MSEYFPKSLDTLGGGEQGAIAAHRVEDQPLVGFEARANPVAAGVVVGGGACRFGVDSHVMGMEALQTGEASINLLPLNQGATP